MVEQRIQLLGPRDVRELAERLDVHPSKSRGQNFMVDAGSVRKIVRTAGVCAGDRIVEVGPGFGSLTLGLLEAGAEVTAIEIDRHLATALPATVAERSPECATHLSVIAQDALTITQFDDPQPMAMVANLPYNIAAPVILTFLQRFPAITAVLVLVQAEVADRVVAQPGSKIYGVPSAKVAWYGTAHRAGDVGRAAFWPVPRVDSALVSIRRTRTDQEEGLRLATFSVIDAAFAQRRKTLRSALSGLVGSGEAAGCLLESAHVDPQERGENLGIAEFTRIGAMLHERR